MNGVPTAGSTPRCSAALSNGIMAGTCTRWAWLRVPGCPRTPTRASSAPEAEPPPRGAPAGNSVEQATGARGHEGRGGGSRLVHGYSGSSHRRLAKEGERGRGGQCQRGGVGVKSVAGRGLVAGCAAAGRPATGNLWSRDGREASLAFVPVFRLEGSPLFSSPILSTPIAYLLDLFV